MRLQAVRSPDAVHHHVREAGARGQLPGRPVRQAGRCGLQGQGDHLGDLASGHGVRAPRAGPIPQPRHPPGCKPAPQPTDLHRGVARAPRDLHAGKPFGHQRHRVGPATQPGRHAAGASQPLQLRALIGCQDDWSSVVSHASSRKSSMANLTLFT